MTGVRSQRLGQIVCRRGKLSKRSQNLHLVISSMTTPSTLLIDNEELPSWWGSRVKIIRSFLLLFGFFVFFCFPGFSEFLSLLDLELRQIPGTNPPIGIFGPIDGCRKWHGRNNAILFLFHLLRNLLRLCDNVDIWIHISAHRFPQSCTVSMEGQCKCNRSAHMLKIGQCSVCLVSSPIELSCH